MSLKKYSKPAKVLVLRNCRADMTSRNGFRWPEKGPVECPDWNPKPVLGGGLHGLLWGRGGWSLLDDSPDAVWQVVEVDADCIVDIDNQMVKFPRGNVIYSGSMAEAVTMVLCHPEAMKSADQVASGYCSAAASSGNGSFATSSGNYSTASSSGYRSLAASSGVGSIAASGGYGSTSASSGYRSTAVSSGESSKAAVSGNYSTAVAKGKDTIAIAAGLDCIVSAGENGCFAAAWYDPTSKRNRIRVGYVGEDGLKSDTPYKITHDGRWEEVRER